MAFMFCMQSMLGLRAIRNMLGRSVIIAHDGRDLVRNGNGGELIAAKLESKTNNIACTNLPYLAVF